MKLKKKKKLNHLKFKEKLILLVFITSGFFLCSLALIYDVILSELKEFGIFGAFFFSYGLFLILFGFYLSYNEDLFNQLINIIRYLFKKWRYLILIAIPLFLILFFFFGLSNLIFSVLTIIFLPGRLLILILAIFTSQQEIIVCLSILIGLPLTFYYWKFIIRKISPKILILFKNIHTISYNSEGNSEKKIEKTDFKLNNTLEKFLVNRKYIILIFLLGLLIRLSFFLFGNIPGDDAPRYLYYIDYWIKNQNLNMFKSISDIFLFNGSFIITYFPLALLIKDSFITIAIISSIVNSLTFYFLFVIVDRISKNKIFAFIFYILINFSYLGWIQSFDLLRESSSLFFLCLSLIFFIKAKDKTFLNSKKRKIIAIFGALIHAFALLYYFMIAFEFVILYFGIILFIQINPIENNYSEDSLNRILNKSDFLLIFKLLFIYFVGFFLISILTNGDYYLKRFQIDFLNEVIRSFKDFIMWQFGNSEIINFNNFNWLYLFLNRLSIMLPLLLSIPGFFLIYKHYEKFFKHHLCPKKLFFTIFFTIILMNTFNFFVIEFWTRFLIYLQIMVFIVIPYSFVFIIEYIHNLIKKSSDVTKATNKLIFLLLFILLVPNFLIYQYVRTPRINDHEKLVLDYIKANNDLSILQNRNNMDATVVSNAHLTAWVSYIFEFNTLGHHLTRIDDLLENKGWLEFYNDFILIIKSKYRHFDSSDWTETDFDNFISSISSDYPIEILYHVNEITIYNISLNS